MDTSNKKHSLFQIDRREYILNKLGREAWITVYGSEKTDSDDVLYFSALIAKDHVAEILQTPGWDLHINEGTPGYVQKHRPDESVSTEYLRFGGLEGIEPLVFIRTFHDLRPQYIEVSEEFRLFHNLYYDQINNKLIRISDDGSEEDVVILDDDSVKIKLKYLKQFLSAKEMYLALYFDARRFSSKTLAQLDLESQSDVIQEDNLHYSFSLSDAIWLLDETRVSLSIITGKKLVASSSRENSGIWPYRGTEEESIEFIVGTDEDGEAIMAICSRDKLGKPYLTPVFFRREVLTKYYANSERYSVSDGYLSCGSLWGMSMDTNHPKYVIAYLGDLGRDLPKSERLYWRTFNVPPEGTISTTAFRRDFLAEFADPERSDLAFKQKYQAVNEAWKSKFGWLLFLPLEDKDSHYLNTLRIPLTNDQSEFDQQVLALAKILVDSLNEKKLKHCIPPPPPGIEELKGIGKLENVLSTQNIPRYEAHRYEAHIGFIRQLYSLRSKGSGHRKGSDYTKIAKAFGVGTKDLSVVFDDILKNAILFLQFMEASIPLLQCPD